VATGAALEPVAAGDDEVGEAAEGEATVTDPRVPVGSAVADGLCEPHALRARTANRVAAARPRESVVMGSPVVECPQWIAEPHAE
jgi:hypothetical protein